MKISVCMATFNGEKYIKEQIESILPQLSQQDEIIVSDNFSCDGTIDILQSFNDNRIHILKFPQIEGISSIESLTLNFENALKYASGDIIFLSDQDDVWLPDKIKVSLKYLREYDYIVSDCYITDSELKIIHNTRFLDSKITKNKWLALFKSTPYQGSCAAFKSKVLKKCFPFPIGLQSHDRWIGFIASFNFKYKIIPEKLIYYRRHGTNISTATTGNSTNTICSKIKYRINYLTNLIKYSNIRRYSR